MIYRVTHSPGTYVCARATVQSATLQFFDNPGYNGFLLGEIVKAGHLFLEIPILLLKEAFQKPVTV